MGPWNEQQAQIDWLESRNDYLYNDPYDPDDYLPGYDDDEDYYDEDED